jgi:hypothetical protein
LNSSQRSWPGLFIKAALSKRNSAGPCLQSMHHQSANSRNGESNGNSDADRHQIRQPIRIDVLEKAVCISASVKESLRTPFQRL